MTALKGWKTLGCWIAPRHWASIQRAPTGGLTSPALPAQVEHDADCQDRDEMGEALLRVKVALA